MFVRDGGTGAFSKLTAGVVFATQKNRHGEFKSRTAPLQEVWVRLLALFLMGGSSIPSASQGEAATLLRTVTYPHD